MSTPPTDMPIIITGKTMLVHYRLNRQVTRAQQSGGNTRPTSDSRAAGRVYESREDLMMRAAVVSAGLGLGLGQMRHITFGRTCARGYSRLTGSPLRQTGKVVTCLCSSIRSQTHQLQLSMGDDLEPFHLIP